MNKDKLREHYIDEESQCLVLKTKEEKSLVTISILRLLTFLGGFAAIYLGYSLGTFTWISLCLLVLIVFSYLLKLYSVHSENKEYLSNLLKIYKNEAGACSGDLTAFESGDSYINNTHDFSNDVDLFGKSSLFQSINRTATEFGRDILAGWFSNPYELTSELYSRQEAIKEISQKEKWRNEFLARGMKKPLTKEKIAGLIDWMKESGDIKTSDFKKFLLIFLPVISLSSFILVIAGFINYSIFIIIFFINLFYVGSGLKEINKIHNNLSKKSDYLFSFNALLKVFENETFTSSSVK